MSLLKRLPIHYKGELHDVRLINFSVAMEEILKMVPANIKVRDFDGRAMISMVDVKLKNMRPVALPFLRFNYRHPRSLHHYGYPIALLKRGSASGRTGFALMSPSTARSVFLSACALAALMT